MTKSVQCPGGGARHLLISRLSRFAVVTNSFARAAFSLSALLVLGCLAQPVHAQSANDDSFTVDANSTNNHLDVLANDNVRTTGSTGFIIAVSQPDQGGFVERSPNRRFLIYTPLPDFVGVETFRYSVYLGGFAFATATVQVTVVGSNTPPVANDDQYQALMDEPLVVDAIAGVLANDFDADNDALTAEINQPTANGRLRLDKDGAFTYWPDPGFVGEDRFSYQAHDGSTASIPALVTITVERSNEPPVIAPIPEQSGSVGIAFVLDLLAYVSDPDTPIENLRFEADVELPSGLMLSEQGQVAGIPTAQSAGPHVVRFLVDDGVNRVGGQFDLIIRDDRVTSFAIEISVAPNPVPIGQTATWSILVTNESNYDVQLATVDGVFTGVVPFTVSGSSNASCNFVQLGDETSFNCLLEPLAIGDSQTVEITGDGAQIGDVLGIAGVTTIEAPTINPSGNEASTTLSIAEQISDVPAQRLTGFSALSLANADFDGDGHTDLAVATDDSNAVLLFFNVQDPVNEYKRRLADAPLSIGLAVADNDIAVGDLDGDLDVDIVAAGSSDAFPRVFLNDGSAGFATMTLDQAVQDASGVSIEDVNADGFFDLVFSGRDGGLLYLGAGVPGMYSGPIGFGDPLGTDVVGANLFGDSRGEFVVTHENGDASIYSFNGSSVDLSLNLQTGPTTSVLAEDFNGDGSIDLVFGRAEIVDPPGLPSNPFFASDSGIGPSFRLANALGAAPTFGLIAADADSDGDVDVFTFNRTGAHQVFSNDGPGSSSFVLAPSLLSAQDAQSATYGRFSVDERSDLSIGGPDGVAVFWSDGRGVLGLGDRQAPSINLIGSSSIELEVGDNYDDAGAVATDSDDGDLTDSLVVSNPVNTSVIGTYVVTYDVRDQSGNAAATATRTVSVGARPAAGGGGGGAMDPLSLVLMLFLLRRLSSRYQGASQRKLPASSILPEPS